MIELTTTTKSDTEKVSWSGCDRMRARDGIEEAARAFGDRLPEQRGDRDEDEEPEVERRDAGAQKAPAVVARGGVPDRPTGRAPLSAVTPRAADLVEDLGHHAVIGVEELGPRDGPPAQVLDREGWPARRSRNWAATSSSSGRKPWLPKTVCASGVYRKSTNACAASGVSPFSVTATGFSMRIVASGTTYSSGWPACCAKIASFS